ncbi:MAG: hypothetical protein V1912_11380 [bacterium]
MSDLPLYISEWKATRPLDDCGLVSWANAARAASHNQCLPTRERMREVSGIPDHVGISDPTWPRHGARALSILCPKLDSEHSEGTMRLSWPQWLDRLNDSAGILNGLHVKLPRHRCHDPSYRFGHSICVVRYRGDLRMFEPLVNDGPDWQGDVLSAAALRPFAESYMSSGDVSGGLVRELPPLIAPQEGTEPMISAGGLTITSSHVLPLSAGTRIHHRPGSDELFSAKAAIRPPYIGKAGGWNAVLINTGNVYPDKVARPTVLYVQGGTPERVSHV